MERPKPQNRNLEKDTWKEDKPIKKPVNEILSQYPKGGDRRRKGPFKRIIDFGWEGQD